MIGLSVSRRSSIKPAGDVITVHVLNRGADAARRQVAQMSDEYSTVTAETSSSIDPKLDT
ncbi:hypothetical protein [Deinococcus sp.]|uniref:hypothetical protein n=1 Tax=Deinococcus sp. TaxID=47478 RepID=UPI0025D57DF0|nr:hypothetical protein [Deinococcus sp.]